MPQTSLFATDLQVLADDARGRIEYEQDAGTRVALPSRQARRAVDPWQE
jgi:hypothetical protein